MCHSCIITAVSLHLLINVTDQVAMETRGFSWVSFVVTILDLQKRHQTNIECRNTFQSFIVLGAFNIKTAKYHDGSFTFLSFMPSRDLDNPDKRRFHYALCI